MLQASYRKYVLRFKRASGTSRGVLSEKSSWFIFLNEKNEPDKIGIGECGLLKGLSVDDHPGFETQLRHICELINSGQTISEKELIDFPSIRFGLETAFLDLASDPSKILFPSAFTQGKAYIPINGLVWMGTIDFMQRQIREKINAGFRCIKLKIGAIDFNQELELIRSIRKSFAASDIEIRVDANGAFKTDEALEKLNQLAAFHIHSIEQPIRQGQWDEMATLIKKSPIPVALDEELIGIHDPVMKQKLLEELKPDFLILKPGLLGGFEAANDWIKLAAQHQTGWWVTSALESNIGLNAIAQWTFRLNNPMPQGLGTGELFTNNIPSPLRIVDGALTYHTELPWKTQILNDEA